MQRKVILWLTVAGMVLVLPLSAMASSFSSTPAGKYGTLYGDNYGWLVTTEVTNNDGTGRLYNKWDVRDNSTGRLYYSDSANSSLGAIVLSNGTSADNYPYPTAVYGTHEVRGQQAYLVYTVTIY